MHYQTDLQKGSALCRARKIQAFEAIKWKHSYVDPQELARQV